MATKLFVGSLSWNTTDDSLNQAFSQFGTVVSANVIRDRATNPSNGFWFVEISYDAEAKEALEKMNGQDLDGRAIVVNEAREKAPRPQFGR